MLKLREDKINIFKTRTVFSADTIRQILKLCNITDVYVVNNRYNMLMHYLNMMDKGSSIIFISDYKLIIDNCNIITFNYARYTNKNKIEYYINSKKFSLVDIKEYAIRYRRLKQLKQLMK